MNMISKVFLAPAYLLLASTASFNESKRMDYPLKNSIKVHFWFALVIWLAWLGVFFTFPLGIGIILSFFFMMAVVMGIPIVEG